MKYVIWLVILGIAGFFFYSYYVKSTSEQETAVRHLERQFRSATDLYVSAVRQAGEVGLAAIADPEAAINKIKEVRSKLTELMETLTEKKAVAKARELEEKIRLFCERNEID